MNARVVSILLAFVIVLLGAAAWTASSSQAQTLTTLPTPTYWTSFAQAEIAKPTYTPLPPPTATQPPPQISLPTEIPTNTPESVAQAVIVDVPAGISSSTNAQAPVAYAGGKLILVDISEQHMYVYEGEMLVYSFVASTGMNNATRTGSFSVLEKIPNAYGATWNIWMPNWLGIYWAGSMQNGIHALPILPNGATLWAGFLGTPISYGCVVLDSYDAQVLYDWAEVGVPVEIQW
jgi:lipoprotein-anchoring transpeptidase ErfK/SrfK